MSKWSKSEPDTSPPSHNLCIQKQRNKIVLFICLNINPKPQSSVSEQRFCNTLWFLAGTGSFAGICLKKKHLFFCCCCLWLELSCQSYRLMTLRAILNLGSLKPLDNYFHGLICVRLWWHLQRIVCRLCSLSDFLFVTQGVCNRDGKMRKEGEEETEEKGD